LPLDWSRDGRFLLYLADGARNESGLMVLPLDSAGGKAGKTFPLFKTAALSRTAQFSPDGRWIAYTSVESGRPEVYVQTFPPSGGKWQISTNGGVMPRWRSDGKEIFYSNSRALWAAGIRLAGQSVEIDTPKMLFPMDVWSGPSFVYDVTPDGQRFFAIQPDDENEESALLHVVSDWQASLNR
jgi:Tol biopolymer transport system component